MTDQKNLSDGSPISFTPDHGWTVQFRTDAGELWYEEVIGWGVVVTCQDATEIDTSVQPFILDEGIPAPIIDYLALRAPGIRWQVQRSLA